jgi:dUTP pyrophosphatase
VTIIKFVRIHEAAIVPSYAHPGDAGADLCSIESVSLAPGERALVRTGLAIQIPEGFVGLVHPRSGLAIKQGLSVINTPGTIDAGYRGEVMVGLVNLDPHSTIDLPAGARIAQLLIQRVERAEFEVVDELDDSVRQGGGFGSTGLTG